MSQSKQSHPVFVASNISFDIRSGVPLFENVSLSLKDEKAGLVGPNGSGKTTLLRLLVGEIEPTRGKIEKRGTVAYLSQDYQLNPKHSIAEALGIKGTLETLDRVTSGEKRADIIKSVGTDWDIRDRVSEKFKQLSIQGLRLDRSLGSLSGGEKTKVIIAKLLLSEPDFIILDEPTNNLDSAAREGIYQLITTWDRGLLVVSHDRSLLNLLDQIFELSSQGLRAYGGNYDSYKEQKELEKQAAERQVVSAEQDLKKTKKQAQKTKEKQQKRSAQGKKVRGKVGMPKIILGRMKETSEATSSRSQELHAKRIENAANALQQAKARISPENEINVDLSGTSIPNGKLVVEMEGLYFSYDDAKLFEDFKLLLHGPIRLAVQGPNGSGKTTLIKLMLCQLKPLRGKVTLGVKRYAYLDQSVAVLDRNMTLLENIKTIAGLDDGSARQWLAQFLFRGQNVVKKVDVLSGGERMRAALACILAGKQPPQLLVLDEPTNNLDLNSIEQIESALRNFRGALVVISHDKDFIRNIGIEQEITLPARN